MKAFAFFVCFALLETVANAQQLKRVPVYADYMDFLENADKRCNECELLLTVRNTKPQGSPLCYVRAKPKKGGPDAEIQAAYFALDRDQKLKSSSSPRAAVDDYQSFSLPSDHLLDGVASAAYTGDYLRKIATHKALAPKATIIVSRLNPYDSEVAMSPIDTSLLIKYAEGDNFIVEQQSGVRQFAANMQRLREREFSQNVMVFDFTPRSTAAVRSMQVDGSALIWRAFSRSVASTFRSYRQPQVLGARTKQALLDSLATQALGGVVILYAHSDGKNIILDTENGIEQLTADDIEAVGKITGGRLPPIILLNCKTRGILGPAFLSAGSPFVATTDQQLGLPSARKFISAFAKAMYVGKEDVLDAYFTAQMIAGPTHLHPIVENVLARTRVALATHR
jgi:hypothetical protein